MKKGQSMRNGGVPSDITSLMQWCISESLLQVWRSKLAKGNYTLLGER